MQLKFKKDTYDWLWKQARKEDKPVNTYISDYFDKLAKSE